MKKALILLAILLLWQNLTADVVSEKKARQIATEFFAAQEIATRASSGKDGDLTLVYTYKRPATRSSEQSPALYVFQKASGGYVVASGDDVARPVLGWSPNGYFPSEAMPENLADIINWYGEVIEFARSQKWKSPAMANSASGEKVILNTAQWGQHYPFNELVYEIDGQKPPIGCVATAIGIIMRYHCWPERGTGTLPAYESYDGVHKEYHHVDPVTLGHKYEWDKMPPEDRYPQGYKYTDEEVAQISRLMYDIAVMCNVNFSNNGSGSITDYAYRLTEYFDYDKNMSFPSRNHALLNDRQWEQSVRDEIDAGRPVIYSGFRSDSGSGHAFVIDGYYDRYFSINLGYGAYAMGDYVQQEWSDYRNGFIFYMTLTPIENHESELIQYYYDQDMVTHLMKNQGGEVPEPYYYLKNNMLTLLSSDFELNKEFHVVCNVTHDSKIEDTRGFRLDLFDKDGSLKETVTAVHSFVLPSYSSYPGFTARITKPLEDGDRIIVMMNDPKTGAWEPVPSTRRNQFIFTSRPLSDLVEIGHEECDNPSENGQKDFYVKFYKDIYWNVIDQSTGLTFFFPSSGPSGFCSVGTSYQEVTTDLIDSSDPDCDTVIMKLALPAGKYLLYFSNPVTGETLNIDLEI